MLVTTNAVLEEARKNLKPLSDAVAAAESEAQEKAEALATTQVKLGAALDRLQKALRGSDADEMAKAQKACRTLDEQVKRETELVQLFERAIQNRKIDAQKVQAAFNQSCERAVRHAANEADSKTLEALKQALRAQMDVRTAIDGRADGLTPICYAIINSENERRASLDRVTKARRALEAVE
jgi:hypothetical protein